MPGDQHSAVLGLQKEIAWELYARFPKAGKYPDIIWRNVCNFDIVVWPTILAGMCQKSRPHWI